MRTSRVTRTARPLAATAVVGALALAAAGVGVELRARAAIAKLLGGTRFSGVTVDAFAGRLTVDDIAFVRDGLRLRVGTLRLSTNDGLIQKLSSLLIAPAQAFPSGDGVPEPGKALPADKQGTASADDVTITYENVTYTIPHIELAGTALDNAAVAAMLDPKSDETVEARLRRLTAASVTVPEIKADTTNGDFEQHWRQTQVLLANVTNGKAAIGSAGVGSLTTKRAQVTTVVEIGSLQASGMDMAQIVHVAATARTDDGETRALLADALTVNAIKLGGAEKSPTATVATVKGVGLRARPLALVSQARSVLLTVGKPGDPAVDAFLGDVAGSTAFKLLEIDGVVVAAATAVDANRAAPVGADRDGSLHLDQASISDFGDRRIGGIQVRGVLFEAPSGHVSLASTQATGIVLPSSYDARTPPVFAGFDLSALSCDVDTADAGQAAKRVAFDIERISYTAPGAAPNVLPPKAAVAMQHLQVALTPDVTSMLLAPSHPKLDVSSQIASSFDATSQVYRLDDWRLIGAGMGTLQLRAEVGNATAALVSHDADAQKAAVAAVTFRGVDLLVNDDGLIDRLLAYKATQDGVSLAQERDAVIDSVRNKLPAIAGDPPKLKPLEDAIARFIADPKLPLHIAIAAPGGLGTADAALLNDPDALLARLTITAQAGN